MTGRWKFFVAPALIALCVLLFIAQFGGMPAPLSLVVEVKGARATRLQLLYDGGHGFQERDSVTQSIESSQGFRKIRFGIEAKTVRDLHLVQLDGAEPLELRRLALKSFGGTRTVIAPSALTPLVNVASITPSDGGVRITGTPAADRLAVGCALPFPIKASPLVEWARCGAVFLLGLSAFAFIWMTSGGVASLPLRSHRGTIIALLTLAYLLGTILKLNGSSTGLWRLRADRKPADAFLLAGASKEIRSDEWMVQTPWILSQWFRAPKLAVHNPNVGEGLAPLLTNLPVRHWSMIFRPQMWGFFCLNLEHAFALYWNFKWYALLLGAFLFLELVTGGKSWLALSGALFLFASPYLQWWFSTPTCLPEMLAMFFFALWSIAMIFRSTSQRRVVLASVGLLFALMQFAFCCYPRFQIPLLYSGAFLLVFGCAGGISFGRFRVACLVTAVSLAGLLLWNWYREVAGLIRLIGTLAYPGQIVSTGGGVSWTQLLAPLIEFGMTERHYPAGAMNVCEAAGFLFVTPILAVVAMRDALRHRADPLVLGCLLLSALLLVFMLAGIPLWLARSTGWSQVYGARALLALGVVSTVGLFRYLSTSGFAVRSRPAVELAGLGVLALGLFLCLARVNLNLGEFVSLTSVAASAMFFALVCLCLWLHRTGAVCALLVIPLCWANGLTNPIGQGLPGLIRSPLGQHLSEIQRRDPAAKWLVLGRAGRSQSMAQFIKAAGVDALGGVNVTPDREMLAALDPDGKFRSIHERYAIISFFPGTGPEPTFELTFVNSYIIHLPLQPELFDRLHVAYVLEVDLAEAEGRIPGFRTLGEWEHCRLLAR